jgi:hypothetical protein
MFDSRSLNPYLGKICPKKLKKERACLGNKVEEPILDTLRFRTTKEFELDMKKN